ncbi:MAG: phage tail protein [Lachnospiraceae bacterium]|nr:phage tail protein [Lachnospiraceae bacterium]
MVYLRNYSIRNNRLKKACITGMEIQGDGVITFRREEEDRYVFLGSIDSARDETRWGRLHFHMERQPEQIVILHVFASDYQEFLRRGVETSVNEFLLDPEALVQHKKAVFQGSGESRFTNQDDILLYDLRGRYLWLFWEVLGIGEGSICDMNVNLPGDNFMNTFPSVYRSEGSFFHRYLSIFSTIYNDFQMEIDHVAEKLDIDRTPVELLPVFASWLGVDVSGDFLSEQQLREFVKEIYKLNRIKGTKQVLERLTEIVLGEKATIVEKNIVNDSLAQSQDERESKLYGDTPYDVTMLVKKYVDEKKKSQLFFLVKQFMPVRCRLNIIYLMENGVLDSYCYLDVNAKVYEKGQALLDDHRNLGSYLVLK